MWINHILGLAGDIFLAGFAVFLLHLFLKIFLSLSTNKNKVLFSFSIFGMWQLFIARLNILPEMLNVIITILLTLLVSFLAFQGRFCRKVIFSISFNTIWMLMEIFCGYIMMAFFDNFLEYQMLGSIISKALLFMIIEMLKIVFLDEEIKELPSKYNILLMLIPIGSIFIVNHIFKLSSSTENNISNYWSVIASFIMLLINVLIFNLYLRLADELELKRIATVYRHQLELYEKHQQERELSLLHLRNIKHNMKNNLIAIMAYAQNQDYDKILDYIEDIMEEKCTLSTDISNSGNIIVDSLVNYWSSIAKKTEIDFQSKITIPIQMPFKGADVCLILGNALENAIEGANKSRNKQKYIKVNMKYDRYNLIISILNTYDGVVLKTRDGKLKSTKTDQNNHGIGLKSIYHTAEKYNGTVVIKSNDKEFLIKILLYDLQNNYINHR